MLERILIKYFDLEEDWNDNYETEKDKWYKSYDKLINLVYDLGELGVLDRDSNIIVDRIDEIDKVNEEDAQNW